MNYTEAIGYIHSVSNFFCKPGLERITALCEKLGNPQNKLKFIHVAGTNGKGSFCSMLSSVLTHAGYKTGLYTSPYILNFNERIQINGKEISNEDLSKITQRVKKYADEMADKPTEFELITAIAFEYFYSQKCDIVILECGLGGKFDATNIISSPVLSVITSVSLDHTAFLGNTVGEIATEKAGIIKKGIPCLLCSKKEDSFDIIRQKATENLSPLFFADKVNLKNIRLSLEKTLFDFEKLKNVELSLLGSYQPENAVNVIYATKILKDKGFNISEISLREGLKSTVWHARFEIINKDPLIIFDGGHNEEGVTAAIKSVKTYLGDTKVNIITGVMKDKDYKFITKKIGEIAKKVHCITPDNPRALSGMLLAKEFENININAQSFDSVKDAVQSVLKSKTPTVILGSLYMYKEIIDSLN